MASSIRAVLEELHLLKCCLLPGELLAFTEDAAVWDALLDAYSGNPDVELPPVHHAAQFVVRTDDSDVWFEVEMPWEEGDNSGRTIPHVAVKGSNLGRSEQERWQAVVAEALEEVRGSEYPLYELISSHLLPRLHAEAAEVEPSSTESAPTIQPAAPPGSIPPPRYHALFTSHHLKSPQKRRSLSQWAHELSLTGFAKVGYPGVIYCEGTREDVEDFVARVKSMQWLALRLRFVEPAPSGGNDTSRRWAEFEKVGEVVEEMRRLGRERFVVDMGIGSAGLAPGTPQ
ncbi:hypothetical protein C2E23DRAFT_726829 [Lenzites betulinus]|nr:hypothetical protein C2E23DRAFT_726829 [Lenzites betulinus]